MGHKLRFLAPSADGADAAAHVTKLDAIHARLVRARADDQPAAAQIHAAPPRNLKPAATASAGFAAAGIALRVDRESNAPPAFVLASARAGVAATESALGLAPVRRAPALAGAAWFRAATRTDATGVRIERANAKACTRRARVHQHLCQCALRWRTLRHISPPPSSGANSRSPPAPLATAPWNTIPEIECGDSGGACEKSACDFCVLHTFSDCFCPKCE